MIEGISATKQTILGTLLTWGLTALGSAIVLFLPQAKRSILDGSLGFAAGVMIAASFWSLLDPAIEMATNSGNYGQNGELAFLPVTIGFIFGALFVYLADIIMSCFGMNSVKESLDSVPAYKKSDMEANGHPYKNVLLEGGEIKHRKTERSFQDNSIHHKKDDGAMMSEQQWKRILLMVVAITVHNIPEGLAVGVGFGAIGKTPSATFTKAKNLAIGIGIQNFPEGMAVSLPLRASGYSFLSAFWWGQLSGMVEPLSGLIGAIAVGICEPLLPYALAFAAGAMILVVVDDIIPEAQNGGNGRLSSFWCITGFVTMMVLDVGLG